MSNKYNLVLVTIFLVSFTANAMAESTTIKPLARVVTCVSTQLSDKDHLNNNQKEAICSCVVGWIERIFSEKQSNIIFSIMHDKDNFDARTPISRLSKNDQISLVSNTNKLYKEAWPACVKAGEEAAYDKAT